MTDNPTTAPTCQDPRKIEHWRENQCWKEDGELLADVHKWRHLSAKLDATFSDPDSDRSDIHTRIG